MTLFTPLIGLLMTLFFTSLLFLSIRKNLTQEIEFCLNEVTQIQIKHRYITKQLLALNPLAKKLRFIRRAAELAHKAAPPKFKAVTYAVLKKVKLKQKFFHASQKALIMKARSLSVISNKNFILKGFVPTKAVSGLQVERVQKRSLSPDYRLKRNYVKKKKIKYIKRHSLFSSWPKSLKKFLKLKNKFKNLHCGSTLLKKGGRPWKVKLILDK